jgi:glyoxylase-like metal-dependent hydrolase (beta-lactamase superfamily II)
MFKCVLVTVVMIMIAAVPASAGLATKQDFETVKVADGVFAFIATESSSGVVQGNVVLIVGSDSAMLIDSGQFPSLAKRMAVKVQELTTKPVRILMNTHWHGDHLLSNHVFKEHFPGVIVIAHENTVLLGEKFYGKFAEQLKGYPKLIEDLRAMAKSGKSSKGRTLTEDEKTGLNIDADALEASLADLSSSRYEPAEMTFQKEISFDLGKRKVRVMNLGRGNTSGDAVILVPDAKVLVTGDTVVYPTPYSFGSYHSEWIEVLKKMTQLGANTYIPGHGPVMNDTSYIETLIALLADVRTQVQAAVKENLSLEDVRKRVQLENWRQRLAGDNPDRRRAFKAFFLDPGLERAYKEAKGEPLTE